MLYYLQNSFFKIAVNSQGAELKSMYHIITDTELIWQGNPTFWAKSSPILFPIVGSLAGNSYLHNGQNYTLPRHGFAREMEFLVENETENSLTFLLKSNYKTKINYPFKFELRVCYELKDKLKVKYSVINTDGYKDLLFAIGAHPAFNVPFAGKNYNDYYIDFGPGITSLNRRLLSASGLLNNQTTPILLKQNKLNISFETFAKDALVFGPNKGFSTLKIGNNFNEKKLIFEYQNFPYFGIWAAPNAPFVCLEPWCGVADNEGFEGELAEKEGINCLKPLQEFKREFFVSFE